MRPEGRTVGWLGVLVLGLTTTGVAQTATPESGVASSAWLSLLPDGETKRRFILDCTGCHQFDESRTLVDGRPRTEAEWREAITKMLGFAGASTAFPVIAAGRDPEGTAAWLVRHLGDRTPTASSGEADARVVHGAVTEFRLPAPRDLPHDIAIDHDGTVVITGMFTHQMYLLTPASGEVTTRSIPVANANPRAVDIDRHGHWWVVLGMPRSLARYNPVDDEWDVFDVGVYPHSLALGDGAVWYNGHFTYQPEIVGRVDVATGDAEPFTVPEHPDDRLAPAGPIPYGLRVAPDGSVWGSELQGNRLIRFDPGTEAFEVVDMPLSWSGPRRFDIDAEGVLWIPAYAANTLYRFDPFSGAFTEFALPIADAVPYIARVDDARGTVWIGTAAADATLALDVATGRFTMYPSPSRGALVRHMTVAPNGDVWLAYGASPGRLPAMVARIALQPRVSPQ